MSDPIFLVDGTELLADAISKFAAKVAEGRYEEAEQFLALAFYLRQHQIHEGER